MKIPIVTILFIATMTSEVFAYGGFDRNISNREYLMNYLFQHGYKILLPYLIATIIVDLLKKRSHLGLFLIIYTLFIFAGVAQFGVMGEYGPAHVLTSYFLLLYLALALVIIVKSAIKFTQIK